MAVHDNSSTKWYRKSACWGASGCLNQLNLESLMYSTVFNGKCYNQNECYRSMPKPAFRSKRETFAFYLLISGIRILVTLLLDTLPMLWNVLAICFFIFAIFGIVAVQLWRGALRGRCFLELPVNISRERWTYKNLLAYASKGIRIIN